MLSDIFGEPRLFIGSDSVIVNYNNAGVPADYNVTLMFNEDLDSQDVDDFTEIGDLGQVSMREGKGAFPFNITSNTTCPLVSRCSLWFTPEGGDAADALWTAPVDGLGKLDGPENTSPVTITSTGSADLSGSLPVITLGYVNTGKEDIRATAYLMSSPDPVNVTDATEVGLLGQWTFFAESDSLPLYLTEAGPCPDDQVCFARIELEGDDYPPLYSHVIDGLGRLATPEGRTLFNLNGIDVGEDAVSVSYVHEGPGSRVSVILMAAADASDVESATELGEVGSIFLRPPIGTASFPRKDFPECPEGMECFLKFEGAWRSGPAYSDALDLGRPAQRPR